MNVGFPAILVAIIYAALAGLIVLMCLNTMGCTDR